MAPKTATVQGPSGLANLDLFAIAIGIRFVLMCLLPLAFDPKSTILTAATVSCSLIFMLFGALSLAANPWMNRSMPTITEGGYLSIFLLGMIGMLYYFSQNPQSAIYGWACDFAGCIGLLLIVRGQAKAPSIDLIQVIGLVGFIPLVIRLFLASRHGFDFILTQDIMHRNAFGYIACIGMIFATISVCTKRTMFSSSLLLFYAAMVVLSFSKTSWILAIVLLILSAVLNFSRGALIFVIVLVASMVAIYILLPSVPEMLSGYLDHYINASHNASITSRKEIWSWAWERMGQNPITYLVGYGYNSGSNFDFPGQGRIYSLHNEGVSALFSFGVVGVGLILLYLATIISSLPRLKYYSPTAYAATLVIGAVFLSRGYSEVSFTATVPFNFLMWIVLSLNVWAFLNSPMARPRPKVQDRRRAS